MADELTDICDENNNLLGVQKMISEAHKDGLWHRTSHIWIYNSKGEILLQLRAEGVPFYPNTWDISAAGHLGAEDSPVNAAVREVKEEIGLDIKERDLDFFMIRKNTIFFKELENNEFYYVFFLKFDGDISQLELQEEEVQKIKFFTINEVERNLQSNPENYVPHGDYWAQILDEVKKRATL